MDIVKIIGLGIAGAVAALVLKEYKPAFALCVGGLTAVIISVLLLNQIGYVLDLVSMLSNYLAVDTAYIRTVLRIIGISYVTHFGSALCADAGQKLIAQNIELAGRVLIVVTSVPVLIAVLNLLIGILPA